MVMWNVVLNLCKLQGWSCRVDLSLCKRSRLSQQQLLMSWISVSDQHQIIHLYKIALLNDVVLLLFLHWLLALWIHRLAHNEQSSACSWRFTDNNFAKNNPFNKGAVSCSSVTVKSCFLAAPCFSAFSRAAVTSELYIATATLSN